jgi:methionyl-tRNA formyltransferase
MAGDTETGDTLHRTTPELDAGPVAARRAFPLEPDDDAGAIFARSAELAVELLGTVLERPLFMPQAGEGATYAEKLTAADRELDPGEPPEQALRRIRALSPHIGARTELHGRRLTVWKAAIVDGELRPLEVQPEGGRRMAYDEFLRGLR